MRWLCIFCTMLIVVSVFWVALAAFSQDRLAINIGLCVVLLSAGGIVFSTNNM